MSVGVDGVPKPVTVNDRVPAPGTLRRLSTPELTVVATVRNDDHGGNLLHRLQLFTSGLLAQCKRHALNAELVLVEWNAPADKPALAEALRWPGDAGWCSVRIITVPAEVHAQFKHADQLPLFQMIGKNAGIRRARGRFVLATNIDILFSDELMHFLSSGDLSRGRMYRVDRYDVPAQVPVEASVEEQLAYCRHNVLRINRRDRTTNLVTGHCHIVSSPWRWRLRECLAPIWPKLLPPTWLHTNGAGDFTLMAREHWFALRGYAEFEMFPSYLDGLLCHAAHHGGAQEQVLLDPMRIYHIEHTGSFGTLEIRKKLNQRLDAAGIPQLKHSQYNAWAIQMRRQGKPIIHNDEHWGLAGEPLPESAVY